MSENCGEEREVIRLIAIEISPDGWWWWVQRIKRLGEKVCLWLFKGPILYLVNLYSVLLVSVPFFNKDI